MHPVVFYPWVSDTSEAQRKHQFFLPVAFDFSRNFFEGCASCFCTDFMDFFFSHKKQMCQGLNSHYFHIIGDGHQPNSRGLTMAQMMVILCWTFEALSF